MQYFQSINDTGKSLSSNWVKIKDDIVVENIILLKFGENTLNYREIFAV